ncbi:hypothetical protein CMI47_03475 [Candidatus Pacearchaeota archaeon]|nr:hypothetical protein [Candidatus Pacearchaeota archaeon]|tara:strand:- start:336 stop:779 length:444 start_codon:yes stop_codon:yes gene_type:complete
MGLIKSVFPRYHRRAFFETVRRLREDTPIVALVNEKPYLILLDVRRNSTCLDGSSTISKQLYENCRNYENVVLNFRERYAFDTSGAAILFVFAKNYPPTRVWVCGDSQAGNVFDITRLEGKLSNLMLRQGTHYRKVLREIRKLENSS